MRPIAAAVGVAAVLLSVARCETIGTQPRPQSGPAPAPKPSEEIAALFPAEGQVMTAAQIRDALDARIAFPPKMRIALVPVAHRSVNPNDSWMWRSPVGEHRLHEGLVKKLLASPRVYDASFLPTMLLGNGRSIDALRTAAARYQADALLLMQSECRLDEKNPLFAKGSSRAHCGIEITLLDVRTGTFPFGSRAVTEALSMEGKDDRTFTDTVRRSENEAIERGMSEAADDLVRFLAQP